MFYFGCWIFLTLFISVRCVGQFDKTLKKSNIIIGLIVSGGALCVAAIFNTSDHDVITSSDPENRLQVTPEPIIPQ